MFIFLHIHSHVKGSNTCIFSVLGQTLRFITLNQLLEGRIQHNSVNFLSLDNGMMKATVLINIHFSDLQDIH